MKNKPAKKEICPVSAVATLLSDTWTMLIIHNLLGTKGAMRFCELERALNGISTRTLTLKLKRLEEQGIVLKGIDGYVLTKMGTKLRPVVKAMESFGKEL